MAGNYFRMQINAWYKTVIVENLTNFLCFVALSIEVFSILFIYEALKNVLVVLGSAAVAFIGSLIVTMSKMKAMWVGGGFWSTGSGETAG